jgi:N-acetylglucosamine kinase-like BadF-type ATPase
VEGGVRAGRYLVVHDAVTNLLGASAGQPGIVVIAGGGAVAYGFTEGGRSWASGGWGYAVGDEGSGYNIGRTAINRVFRALDGRDPPTQLADPLLRYFDVSGPVALKYAILSGGIGFQDIAGLPPLVAQIAAGGDATAQRLLQEAGQHLAEAAVAVARALEMQESPMNVYFTGGLLHETHYLVPSFQRAARQALPQASFRQPAFEPVVGTLFLAFQELGQPIDRFLLSALSEGWKAKQGDGS